MTNYYRPNNHLAVGARRLHNGRYRCLLKAEAAFSLLRTQFGVRFG